MNIRGKISIVNIFPWINQEIDVLGYTPFRKYYDISRMTKCKAYVTPIFRREVAATYLEEENQ